MMQGTWTQVPLAAVEALRSASSSLVCRAALYLCAVAPHDKTASQLAEWLGCTVRHARNIMRELEALGIAMRPRKGAICLAQLPEMGLSELIGTDKTTSERSAKGDPGSVGNQRPGARKATSPFRKPAPSVPVPSVPAAQNRNGSSSQTERPLPAKGTANSPTTRNYKKPDQYERTTCAKNEGGGEEETSHSEGMTIFLEIWSDVMTLPVQKHRIPSGDWHSLTDAMKPYDDAHRRAIVRHYLASDGPPGETGVYAQLYRNRNWRPRYLVNNLERHAEATAERNQSPKPPPPVSSLSMEARLINGLERRAASHREGAARSAYTELLRELRSHIEQDGELRTDLWGLLDEAFLKLLIPRLSQASRSTLRDKLAATPKRDRIATALGWIRQQGIATPMDLAASPEPHHIAEAAE